MSSVGATTRSRTESARSGRPPRETTADTPAELRGRDKSRSAAGARAEQSERHLMGCRIPIEPANGVDHAARKQRNVEDVRAVALFFRREEIEQQSRHAAFVERFADNLVARTEAARAASVREGDERRSAARNAQGSAKPQRRNNHFAGLRSARLFPPCWRSGDVRSIAGSFLLGILSDNRRSRIDRRQKGIRRKRLVGPI